MQVVVLNGSPKGPKGVTFQSLRYLEKKLAEHRFETFHVGQTIGRLEREPEAFAAIVDAVRRADLVVWCTPVYFLLVPSQLKRFIELIPERGVADAFAGKYATALTTSVHFFDHTAHDYLHAVSQDLGMEFVEGYSADMGDLLKEPERERLLTFARYVLDHVARRWAGDRRFSPLPAAPARYEPGPTEDAPKSSSRRAVLVTDAGPEDASLRAMIDVFTRRLPVKLDVVDLNALDMRGGCLGCCRCAWDNTCFYGDGYTQVIREKVMSAELCVMAGTTRDRFLSARFKRYIDRLFFNGHRPSMAGQRVIHLVSGPLSQLPGLTQVLEGICDVGRMDHLGMVSDEGDAAGVTARLEAMARRAEWALDRKLSRPGTFLAAGGHRIFRDLVTELDWFFAADDRFYREHGLYDYPRRTLRTIGMKLMMSTLCRFEGPRKRIYAEAVDRMVEPFEKVVAGA